MSHRVSKTKSKMTLQNYTFNVNPFLPAGGSPFQHSPLPQVNNNLYYNVPQPSYSPDYNSPSRHQLPNYNNPRIEPYQKPASPSGYGNPTSNTLQDPQYSSQGKAPESYPYYQQNAPSYPAPKDNVYPSQPPPVPPTPSKRIPPPPAVHSTTARPQYTRVEGSSGGKTSVHAILDYDNDFDEYYDEDEELPHYKYNHVTPIQGPITIRNNSVPVVPLYSYDTVNNGSLLQIPILWTALSVALGYEVKGDFIRGPPCIKKYHQLYCPTAGSTYPINKIEKFIDDNKALMRRMYGEFSTAPDFGAPGSQRFSNARNRKRHVHDGADYIDDILLPESTGQGKKGGRKVRQSSPLPSTNKDDSGRVDACESKTDIVTPYWASNSAGKVRAIVNTEHFEQAIHQEVCTKSKTGRCAADCGCEQKYKWHRLLAYDPDNDCKGIFMDWFLFPSCCVCRCNPAKK